MLTFCVNLRRHKKLILKTNFFVGFEEKSIWTLKKGKRKGTEDLVSIFTFEIRAGCEAAYELAKSSLKRIKTLRHPSVLQFLDSFENDKVIYIATEYVEPLGLYLGKLSSDPRRDLYLAWAIFQITVRF
jgi:SCY1-like protein 1